MSRDHFWRSLSRDTNVDVHEKENLRDEIHKLWDLESIGIREENDVYVEFEDNILFKNNRYHVKLPWEAGVHNLSENKELARLRLTSQIKKVKKDPLIFAEYDRVMRDQLSAGILEPVVNVETKGKHYIPHHPVVRADAESTKVRVVYDASAKAKKAEKSLNECLHTGPSLTTVLYDVLLRMRTYPVMLVADIEKAFLQIAVDEADRDYLKLLWIDDIEKQTPEIQEYGFTRVIFGAGPCPFLLSPL